MIKSSDLRGPYYAKIFVFISYAHEETMRNFKQKSNVTVFEITMDSAGNINNLAKKFESTTLLEQRMKNSLLVASVIVRGKKEKNDCKCRPWILHRPYTSNSLTYLLILVLLTFIGCLL